MNIYIVQDDERNVEFVYDEETFKKEYKKWILSPPIYSNQNYWTHYTNVTKWECNTENSTSVSPEDVAALL